MRSARIGVRLDWRERKRQIGGTGSKDRVAGRGRTRVNENASFRVFSLAEAIDSAGGDVYRRDLGLVASGQRGGGKSVPSRAWFRSTESTDRLTAERRSKALQTIERRQFAECQIEDD